ncbi:hypothetical protein [Actinopolymorpha rutila]|uniref:Uncharacterized protein n=1 Tax=Actinopolymorpha rutila TaxID=446787 RepID=A0A852ZR76_9ACTN|nr:hypothetical protein [Actinopolymorpha rutila]NYH91530.1 hypothetical protein [Actinopolymorpha rutila]
MVDGDGSTSDGRQVPIPQRGLVETARRLVGHVASRLPGLDADLGQRNAWEAVCADLQRRQQWNDVVELAVNAGRRPARRRHAPPTQRSTSTSAGPPSSARAARRAPDQS